MKMLNIYIYKLYQLTYDEVLIVEPQISMTREDYEKGGVL